MTALKSNTSLKDIFGDINYAWELLEAEVRMETSELEAVSGEDISNLLQLYMRGVEKMNTLVDIRQSFFKNKVTALMSRPTVIKILNKPMTKKTQPAMADCSSPQNVKTTKTNLQKQEMSSSSAKKITHTQKELQLKSKKQSMQMRLAYSAQENNPDALKKMLAEHSQKETFLTQKIVKIVDSHEERLRKRISQRKIRAMTVKQKSEMNFDSEMGQGIQTNFHDLDESFKNIRIEVQESKVERKHEKSPIKSNVLESSSEKKIEGQSLRSAKNRRYMSLSGKRKDPLDSDFEQKQKSKLRRKTSLELLNNTEIDEVILKLIKDQKEKKVGAQSNLQPTMQ